MSLPQDEELAQILAEWTREEREAERIEPPKTAELSQDESVKDIADEKTEIVRKVRHRL